MNGSSSLAGASVGGTPTPMGKSFDDAATVAAVAKFVVGPGTGAAADAEPTAADIVIAAPAKVAGASVGTETGALSASSVGSDNSSESGSKSSISGSAQLGLSP